MRLFRWHGGRGKPKPRSLERLSTTDEADAAGRAKTSGAALDGLVGHR